MPSDYYILRDGEPQCCDDILEWGRWFEAATKTGERLIAQDRDEHAAPDGVLVSTVFLGLNHNFNGKGQPILWETLVFGGVLDGEMDRYSSRAAALDGHQRMCRRVNETIARPSDSAVKIERK